MSVVAAIEKMVAKGLTYEDALEIAKMLQPGPTASALRMRRYRKRKAAESVTCDAHVTVTSDAGSPRLSPKDNIKPPLSSPLRPSVKARPSRRMPATWSPTAADLAKVAEMGFSPGEIEHHLATMRDGEFKNSYTDWSAFFRNWFRGKSPNAKCFQQPSAKLIAFETNMANALAGAQMAANARRFSD